MFTPALTAFGAQVTHAPSPSLSLSAIAQTTLVQAVRRDNPPNILTNDQTCGYTSGVWSSAVICGPQASCTYYTGPSAPNFGCCTDGQGCDYVSTCMDYGAKGNIFSGGGVGLGDQKFMCGSLVPYCSTLLLYGPTYGSGSTQSFYYYSCQETSAPAVIAYQTTFNERDETTSSAASLSALTVTTTITTQASSTAISTTSTILSSTSSTSIPASSSSIASSSSLQSTQTSASITSTKSVALSNDPSSTSVTSTATSTGQASSNGLSQTSQIGIAVGVSIGVCLLLASIAFLFFRHRKAKSQRQWLDQPPQNISVYPHHMDSTKAAYPFDYKSKFQRTNLSGKSESGVEETYELSSAGRLHELPANH